MIIFVNVNSDIQYIILTIIIISYGRMMMIIII